MTSINKGPEGQQGLGLLERPALVGAAAVAAGALALKGVSEAYARVRRSRYTQEQFEMATEPSSIVPYVEFVLNWAEENGLEVVIAGGIAKKALIDPETQFDSNPQIRTMRVSDNPNCLARKSATVLRPDEVTERDIDIFCKYLHVGEGANRKRVVADRFDPEIEELIIARGKELQKKIDEFAEKRGLEIGPEISLFAYDSPYGHNFNLLDYATRTELLEGEEVERLFDNAGNSYEMPVDAQWTLLVGGLRIPVNSPQVQLGRTLNRPVVARKRDLADVNAAILNLKNKGLWQGKMVSMWPLHQAFRIAMNESLKLSQISAERSASVILHKLGMKALAPFTGIIEDSSLTSAAIRDRRGPFSKLSGEVMNSSSGK
jgi:hypothetical protein